jgi:hypothetical protein
MKKIINSTCGLLIILNLIFTFESCTSKSEESYQKKVIKEKAESEKQAELEKKQSNINDSLKSLLFNRYSTVTNLDSIGYYSYTYIYQNLLKKSNQMLFMREAFIVDIEKINENYLISINCFYRNIFGKFVINSQLSSRLNNELEETKKIAKCCVVVKVTELTSNKMDLPDEKSGPFYLLKGELIDYYFLE